MRSLFVLAAVVASACAQNPQPAAPAQTAAPAAQASAFVELQNPANGTRVALKKGGELKLLLDADPVRQTHWVAADNVGPVLSPIGQRAFVSKSSNVIDIAAGGWNIFRYRAEQAGKVTLTLEARRTDAPAPALRTVRYEVTVE